MVAFDNLEDALEEAVFCANDEKRKYIVREKHGKFYALPKYRKGVRRYKHIEVGFKSEVRDA
jgi:hypothetical protein